MTILGRFSTHWDGGMWCDVVGAFFASIVRVENEFNIFAVEETSWDIVRYGF